MAISSEPLPLVYSCSGCSSAAQMANHLALRLDRAGLAEMSCIAGVGGNVASLVRVAREAVQRGRPIVAIDGCALTCVRACLAQRGLTATLQVQLAEAGIKRRKGVDFDHAEAQRVYGTLSERVRALHDTRIEPGE